MVVVPLLPLCSQIDVGATMNSLLGDTFSRENNMHGSGFHDRDRQFASQILGAMTQSCYVGTRDIRSHIIRGPYCTAWYPIQFIIICGWKSNTVKCHYNACHYNANASLTRSSLGSQTAPTCPHDHPRVAQHMGYRCEIIAVWSATAAMTPLCSHTNGIKQRYPTCWLCQYSRFMIDLRSNTLIIHLRCSENAINRSIWLPDARMLKTISVAIKSTQAMRSKLARLRLTNYGVESQARYQNNYGT